MEFTFISHKPWIDETVRLRKALVFTTIFMVILGLILAILGIVLLAYMEFVVGVISVVFGILLPLGYVGANIVLFARRRKAFDKSMIIEYSFDEKGLTITKLSDTYKAKSVIDYVNLKFDKTFKKSRFIMLNTKNYYTDMIALRKTDIVLQEGENLEHAVVRFTTFIMSKIEEASLEEQVTCQDTPSDNETVAAVVEDNDAHFEDLTERDENVDIVDEADNGEVDVSPVKCEVIEENEVLTQPNQQDTTVNEEAVPVEEKPSQPTDSSLFQYDEVIVDSIPHEEVEVSDNSDLLDYNSNEGNDDKFSDF